MHVVVALVCCGLIAGVTSAAAAWRWPAAAAPRISAKTLVLESEQHSSLARVLWARVDATRVSGIALGAVLVATIVGSFLTGLVLWMVRSHTGLARLDLSAARWGAANATTGSTDLLRDISQLGGTVGSILLALIVSVAVRQRLRLRQVLAFLAIVWIGNSVLVATVKALVDRARPEIDQLTGFSGASFPSGHAATAAATFAAAALLLGYGRGRGERASLAGIAVGIAVTVAATRVLLGVHWLTDVAAGLVLGWTWFAIVSIAFGGRLMRFGEPVEAAERVIAGGTPRH